MTIPVCANCSAPLPAGHGEQKCSYCGSLNVIEAPDIPLPEARVLRKAASSTQGDEPASLRGVRSGRSLVWVWGALVLAAVSVAGIALRAPSRREPEAPRVQPLHAPDLHGLGDDFTEVHRLDPKDILPLGAFDPLDRLPWATALAHTWAPDARLVDLELYMVPETGVVDLASPSAVGRIRYQFASKGRDTACKEMVKVSEKACWSAVDVVVEKGELWGVVSPNSSDDRDPTPITFGCGVPKIIETWRPFGLPFRKEYTLHLYDTLNGAGRYWRSDNWGVPELDTSCQRRR